MAVADWVVRAVNEYRIGRPVAFFFDYDGTLTPLVPHPGLAVLPAETRGLLAALSALDRVAVAVVSSRALGQLKEFIRLPGLVYAGSGGMHLDLGDHERVDPAIGEFDAVADAIILATAPLVSWHAGAWVERKPGCLTIHYRALSEGQASSLIEEVRAFLDGLRDVCPPLRVREVTRSLEVALAASWTKGTAVEQILRSRADAPFAVYAGDGANDLEAVLAVNARPGVTVGIGPEAPRSAAARVATQAAFTRDLSDLFRELSCGRAATPGERASADYSQLPGELIPASST